MKYYILLASILLSTGICYSQRSVNNVNIGWFFHAGGTLESLDTSKNDWEEVNLPHDFQIHQPWVAPSADERPDLENPMANIKSRLSSRGFKEMGIGWYRKSFVPSEEWKGKRVLLDFEGIMLVGDVFMNGQYIGGLWLSRL